MTVLWQDDDGITRVWLCSICHEAGTDSHVRAVPVRGGGGLWRCDLGHQIGVWMDDGVLDLGIIRAPEPGKTNDLDVFWERFTEVHEEGVAFVDFSDDRRRR